MPPVIESTYRGTGLDHPRAVAYAVRHWGITDRARTLARQRCEDKLADKNATWTEHKEAVRLLALLDSLDDRRERQRTAERQGEAALGIAAVRAQVSAQLAASLASDPGGLARLAAGQTVISVSPECPTPTESSEAASPPVCQRCDGATVLVTDAGATPCPACQVTPPAERRPRSTPKHRNRSKLTAGLGGAPSESPADPAELAY